jgi:hypothetical protein
LPGFLRNTGKGWVTPGTGCCARHQPRSAGVERQGRRPDAEIQHLGHREGGDEPALGSAIWLDCGVIR